LKVCREARPSSSTDDGAAQSLRDVLPRVGRLRLERIAKTYQAWSLGQRIYDRLGRFRVPYGDKAWEWLIPISVGMVSLTDPLTM
jgi:hypothetical protein